MLQNLFDTHSHYDDSRFDADRDALLTSLPAQGVTRIFHAGADMASSRSGVAFAKAYEHMYTSVGIHPHDAAQCTESAIAELTALATYEKVMAIGEIGLDYFYEPVDKPLQKRAFERQLALANKLCLPVIIHSRDATQDTLDLLKAYRPQGIVHCFSGGVEMAREVLNLGMYLGFTGALTFKNARRPVEVVAYAPMDRLLLETDCPYMAPEPHRGKRCDSSLLEFTARRMAEIKGLAPQAVADATTQNALTVYGIAK